jgi:hypothetical protein
MSIPWFLRLHSLRLRCIQTSNQWLLERYLSVDHLTLLCLQIPCKSFLIQLDHYMVSVVWDIDILGKDCSVESFHDCICDWFANISKNFFLRRVFVSNLSVNGREGKRTWSKVYVPRPDKWQQSFVLSVVKAMFPLLSL